MNRETEQREGRGRRVAASDRPVQRSGGVGKRTRSGSSFSRWWHYQWRVNRGPMIALSVGLALLLVVGGVLIWWNQWAVAPDIPPIGGDGQVDDGHLDSGNSGGKNPDGSGGGLNTETSDGQFSGLTELEVEEEIPAYVSNQKEGVYTFLVIGRTRLDDNADLLMLVVFDSNTGEIDACNIPRDTMINLDRDIKKINASIFRGVNNTKSWVRKTTGIQPNFYVMVDWQAVGDLVNAVGGIYYDVPFRMFYIDGTEDVGFTIDLEPGYQLLDGDKAMQLLRWRRNKYPEDQAAASAAGFDGSDTKRAEMQQAFLVEAAKQILQLKNAKYIGAMAQAFIDNVETDLKVGNIAWFGQQALTKDSPNKVQFHTLPGNYINSCYSRTYRNYQSYVTFYPKQLLEMVNLHMNPYESPITMDGLDLMQINSDGTISSTTGAVADKEHDVALKIYKDVQAGLAYYDRDGTPIYYETPPDTSGEKDPDGENGDQPDGEKPDGEESTGGGSGGGEEPAEPPAVTPEEPSEPGGTDGNTSDQGQ